MSANLSLLTAAPGRVRRSLSKIYFLEAKMEFLKVWRMPAYSIPTLTFPVMFYLLFGVAFGGSQTAGPVSMSTFLLATYGAFGVIGAALFGFGVGVAVERGQGWMLLKRASPMPPGAYFAAKVFLATLFGAIVVALLFTLGSTLGNVSMPTTTWLRLAAVLIAGALPFCAMGLVLGSYAGPNSAPAVVNLIYLPMAFASGLWIPFPVLPAIVQKIGFWLPPYHYSQLALKVIGASEGRPAGQHVAYLLVFTAVCLGLAWLGYRRDEGKTYG